VRLWGKRNWQAAYKDPQHLLTLKGKGLMAPKSLIRGVVIK
jgi:hypothetical protein